MPAQDVVFDLDDGGGLAFAIHVTSAFTVGYPSRPVKSACRRVQHDVSLDGWARSAASSCAIGLSTTPRAVIGPE